MLNRALSPTLYMLAASSLAVGLLLASCGDDEGASGDSPCDTTFAGQCGSPCGDDNDCPSGMYCGTTGCFADCTDGSQCESGVCKANGACQSGSGTGGAGGGSLLGGDGVGNSGTGGSCGEVTVSFAPQTPTVVLLIDQSGSMTEDFQGQPRWDVVYDALMNPTDGVVATLEGQVRFGLALYTYTSGPTCPEIVDVLPPALNNHATIDGVYSNEVPEANTPTGDSITAITPALDAFAEPGPKLIILATDGEPDRCEDPDGHDQISRDEATAAAQAAHALGIDTVIIAVGNQVSQTHQQDMANAGAGLPVPAANPCNDPMVCAPTYEPTTKQGLIDAFNDIINGQRTCIFDLDGEVLDGKECDGVVEINGMTLVCNDPDGWQLNSPTQIEFLGSACDSILNDDNVQISASFPCDAVIGGTPN